MNDTGEGESDGKAPSILEKVAWSVGVRLLPFDSSWKWRPHFTVTYGVLGGYRGSYPAKGGWGTYSQEGVLRGFAFCLAVDHDFGDPGGFFATYGFGGYKVTPMPKTQDGENATDSSGGGPILGIGYLF